jgi:hypothetical protein
MSFAVFDPEAIMRRVRAAAKARELAKTANPLKTEAEFSRLAELAAASGSCDTADPAALDPAVVEERAGLAADRVPAAYLDAWARLNHQRPFRVSDDEWRRALDDGGLFLDAWGEDAAAMDWTPGDLFDVTAGLIWRLDGRRAETIGGGPRSAERRRAPAQEPAHPSLK